MSKLNLRIFLISALFLSLPFFVKAAECNESTIVKVTARDPNGSYIAGASVDVYTQTVDADGNKKPGTRMGGGTTDATLGYATITFKNSAVVSAPYVFRIRTIGKDSASFWFFDNTLGCGETTTVSKTLSGILVSLRAANGDVLTNTSFSIYTQLRDASGVLQNTKNELMGSYNSGSSGQVKLYLPQGSVRGLSSGASDYYVLEVNHGGVKSYIYNIAVNDSNITETLFYLSILRIRLKYDSGPSAVGATVEVYTQKVNLNNEAQTDVKVGTFTIADNGYGSIEVSPGMYALKVKVGNTYQTFWDNNVADGQTSEFLLTLNGSPTSASSTTACLNVSKVNIALRDIAGHNAAGLKFEIYEQGTDANGLPVAGTKMAAGTVDSGGRATVSFKPDSSKNYALKVWDKKADLGEFWYFNVVKFVCDYDRNITKSLPALKIVLRDSDGKPRYNYSFSLYAQRYDVDGNPTFAATDLIANLKTGSDGQAIVYVSPYNVYHSNQTGYYAISTKDGNNAVKNFYNILVTDERDFTYQPSFSGLTGELRDAQDRALSVNSMSLYEQKSSGGYFSLGQKLLSFKTDASGQFKFEYSAGTYALTSTDDLGRQNIFWNIVIGQSSTYKKLTTSLINFNFTDPTGRTDSTLQLFTLTGKGGTYYRGDMIKTMKLSNGHAAYSLAAGTYLISYTGTNDRLFGQAFYAKNGYTYNLNFSTSAKYSLNGKTAFSLAASDSNKATPAPTISNSTGSAVPTTGTIANRLKGRILLQVQDKGQAWYINPVDGERYSLGRPEDAYNLMRKLALGVSNESFSSIENSPSSWKKLAGRILLKVEDSGKAYYFDPTDLKLYYLGRPADAFNVMRNRGLGITNSDLSKVKVAD